MSVWHLVLAVMTAAVSTSLAGTVAADDGALEQAVREWEKHVVFRQERIDAHGPGASEHHYVPSLVPTEMPDASFAKSVFLQTAVAASEQASSSIPAVLPIELPSVENTVGVGVKKYHAQFTGGPLKLFGRTGNFCEEKKKPVPNQGSRPHLLVFLTDDLGYHDVGYADSPREMSVLATPFMTKLAKEEGIILTRHYASWHCSPSRRSFLTGRLPIHVGGDDLTHFADDHMDVRFTWVSEKLKSAGYTNLFYGKGHIGAKSVSMLPVHRGFDYHSGFLSGSASYKSSERWIDLGPSNFRTFSTQLWGDDMYSRISKLINDDPEARVFLYASWQTPHSPLSSPPKKYKKAHKNMNLLDHNILALDVEMNRVVNLFKKDPAIWNSTLVVFISDNGGTTTNNYGNNWPLRSEKGTSFEGSMRATGFVAGGIVPTALHGTKNSHVMHIADWYATFCGLAGVSAADPSPSPLRFPNAKPSDVLDPHFPAVILNSGEHVNVYGNAFPEVDTKNAWQVLVQPDAYPIDHLHQELAISNEAFIVNGRYKLVIAQPCSKGIQGDKDCKEEADYGWVSAENFRLWEKSPDVADLPCLQKFDDRKGLGSIQFKPCLFDLLEDEQERNPIDDPELIENLWKRFNQTLVFQYNMHLPGKENGTSPRGCLGTCVSPSDALKIFKLRGDIDAPHCGLDFLQDLDKKFC